jgi:hypothetical protein
LFCITNCYLTCCFCCGSQIWSNTKQIQISYIFEVENFFKPYRSRFPKLKRLKLNSFWRIFIFSPSSAYKINMADNIITANQPINLRIWSICVRKIYIMKYMYADISKSTIEKNSTWFTHDVSWIFHIDCYVYSFL